MSRQVWKHSIEMSYAIPAHSTEVSLPLVKRADAGMRLSAVTTATHSDHSVFQRFIAGDNAAFTDLYERHNQRLFIYCVKIVRDTQLAEDITHTVWEKTIRLRSDLGDVTNPLGFFYRTARNLCFDHLKHLKFQTSLDAMPDSHHPSVSAAELSEEEELVIRALDELPPETKEILVLHYYSGYNAEEIATMLDKKPNAIWTRISRARTQLKELVERQLTAQRRITE